MWLWRMEGALGTRQKDGGTEERRQQGRGQRRWMQSRGAAAARRRRRSRGSRATGHSRRPRSRLPPVLYAPELVQLPCLDLILNRSHKEV